MSEVTYYRWTAALPIVVPAVAFALAPAEREFPSWFDAAVGSIAYSGLFAGPVYILVAIVGFWLLRDKPLVWYRIASVIAPVLFIPILFLYSFALGEWDAARPIAGAMLIASTLAFGYAYVVLIHLGRWVLASLGRVGDLDQLAAKPPAAAAD